MSESVDVVVIGAGAMGSTAAWQLAKAGRKVVLLEQFGRLHDRGSSHGQTRVFRVSYRDPLYTSLAVDSIPRWRELESDSGQVLLEQSGQLDHGFAPAIDEITASLEGAGFDYERLTPDEAAERWPGLAFDTTVLYSPDGGRVFADRMVDAAITSAQEYGARVLFDTQVQRIDPHGDGVEIVTDGETFLADSVIVAAGAWLTTLVGPGTAWDLPLPEVTVTRQQPVHFAIRPGISFPSYIHHIPDDAPGAALRFGAYGLESPGEGVKLGLETSILCPDPDVPGEVDPQITADAIAYAEQWLPGADTSQVSAVTCLFTNTPDSHFIIDRVGPIVVCSPCSGHGFKFAPEIGAIAADLAMGGERRHAEWRLPD